jgi:hypothetical protein
MIDTMQPQPRSADAMLLDIVAHADESLLDFYVKSIQRWDAPDLGPAARYFHAVTLREEGTE